MAPVYAGWEGGVQSACGEWRLKQAKPMVSAKKWRTGIQESATPFTEERHEAFERTIGYPDTDRAPGAARALAAMTRFRTWLEGANRLPRRQPLPPPVRRQSGRAGNQGRMFSALRRGRRP